MKKNQIKLAFILPSLVAGGAERILSFLAQNIDRANFDAQLVIIGSESNSAYSTKGINTTFFNKKRVLFGIPNLIIHLIKNKPDIVLSSIGHLNTVFGLIAPFFPKTKFIIREASVISEMTKFSNSNKLYGLLAKIAYQNIDAVVCQSTDMATDFQNIYNIPTKKISVINNPITEILPLKKKNNPNEIIRYITVGRLSGEKGYDRLLNILAQLTHPFHYTIVGSGPNKEEIYKMIEKLGLTDVITHIPFTSSIGSVLSEHDVFLQGSYVEGFPNAILESCVVGTPVVAFDCPGGTREIIEEDINGYLAKNNEDFLNKLTKINNRRWKPEDIRNSVIYKFNKQKILSQYEELLINL